MPLGEEDFAEFLFPVPRRGRYAGDGTVSAREFGVQPIGIMLAGEDLAFLEKGRVGRRLTRAYNRKDNIWLPHVIGVVPIGFDRSINFKMKIERGARIVLVDAGQCPSFGWTVPFPIPVERRIARHQLV